MPIPCLTSSTSRGRVRKTGHFRTSTRLNGCLYCQQALGSLLWFLNRTRPDWGMGIQHGSKRINMLVERTSAKSGRTPRSTSERSGSERSTHRNDDACMHSTRGPTRTSGAAGTDTDTKTRADHTPTPGSTTFATAGQGGKRRLGDVRQLMLVAEKSPLALLQQRARRGRGDGLRADVRWRRACWDMAPEMVRMFGIQMTRPCVRGMLASFSIKAAPPHACQSQCGGW